MPLVLFAGGMGVLYWLYRRRRGVRPRRISLATYNLQAYDDDTRISPLVNVIHDMDADVVVLQELGKRAAERIQEELERDYRYMLLEPDSDDPVNGQGILSRYPIVAGNYWRHTMGFQSAVIRVKDTMLNLFNAHPCTPLDMSYAQRAHEIDDLLQRAAQATGPIVLAGDFNMEEWSADYERISALYIDSYREVGRHNGFTFPDSVGGIPVISWFVKPAFRLDYIFHNNAVRTLKARVWHESGGSDHRPVRTVLLLNPRPKNRRKRHPTNR